MDPIVREQTRYLELRLAACLARPELHAHQIAAYQNHLHLIADAADAGDYVRRADMFEIAQAEALDRYYNDVCIHAAVEADRAVSAALLWYEAAAGAIDHADLTVKLGAAARGSQRLQQADQQTVGLVPRLLIALMEHATEAVPKAREERLAEVRACWRGLCEGDMECSWSRICDYTPYRIQSPFGDQRMRRIGAWLEQALGEQPQPDEDGPEPSNVRELLAKATALKESVLELMSERAARRARATGSGSAAATAIPSAAQAAAGYHVSFESLERSGGVGSAARSVFERLFAIEESAEDALGFVRLMAEEHMSARIAAAPRIDGATQARQQCRALGQPHLEHHCDELIAALLPCKSPTEVEFEVARLELAHRVETAWHEVLFAYATRAIGAVLAYEAGRGEQQRKTARMSYLMVCDFFGRDWSAMLDTPWLRDLFDKLVFDRGQDLAPSAASRPGARRGELGIPLTLEARDAAIWCAVDEGSRASFTTAEEAQRFIAESARPRFATSEAMRAHLTDLFREALQGGAAAVRIARPERQQLRFWSSRVDLDDLAEVILAPPRPEIRFS